MEPRKGDSETTSGCSERSPGCIVDRGGFVVWKRRCRVSEGERGVADVGISSALRAASFFEESEVSITNINTGEWGWYALPVLLLPLVSRIDFAFRYSRF